MSDNLINMIFNFLGILIIVIIIAAIWFAIWTALRYPVTMKESILKERDDAQRELLEIQAAKSIEWDKYKELEDERDKLRKAYFAEKEQVEKLKEQRTKLAVEKENLIATNKELKKQKKTA